MVVHAKSKRKISYGEIAKTAKVPDPLPKVEQGRSQAAVAVPADRQGHPARVDVPSKVNGTARIRHRRAIAGACSTARSCYPEVQHEKALTGRRQRRQEDEGRRQDRDRCRSASASSPRRSKPPCAPRKRSRSPGARPRQGQTYTQDRVLADYRAIAARLVQDRRHHGQEGRCRRGDQGRGQGARRGLFLRARLACLHGAAQRHRLDLGRQGPGLVRQSGAGGHADPGVDRRRHQAATRSPCTPCCSAAASAAASDGDDVMHATMLAKAVDGRPVKLIWNRSDDMMNDKFRPLTAQRVEVGLDAKGDIVGWRHRIVNETYLGRVLPPPVFKKIGMHDAGVGRWRRDELCRRPSPCRVGAGLARRRCRRLARHRRRLHQVRDRNADRRTGRTTRTWTRWCTGCPC